MRYSSAITTTTTKSSAAAASSKMETGLLQPAWRRSHFSSLRLFTAVLALVVLQGTLTHAQVDVEPRQVTLTEGEKTSLLCRSGKPINYCRFEVPGEKQVLVLSEKWPSKVPGYSYEGQGMAAGQCGLTIDRISAKNHGTAKCYLGIEGDEFTGLIELTVALPPHRPEIETSKPQRGFFEAGELFQARCISRDGRPAANITWLLNDEPITEGVAMPEIVESTGEGESGKLFTTIQDLRRTLQASDDGKFLVCRTSHIADRQQDNLVKQQLSVRYGPVQQEVITVYGVTLTRTALINVTIQANPRPIIEWKVSGVVIPQGTQNGRYEAYEPTDIGNGQYNVVLSIDALTLEDTTKDYFLTASNELGRQDYTVRISSSTTPAASGLDIGAIIGIVVAVAVLLIIVILIVFARATGRWCFGENSSKPPTSETSDTESAELRTTKFKKLPTFNAIFKKKSGSAQQPTESERNEGQNEDEQRLQVVTTDAAQATDSQEPKEDKQLVYAELVLKPADDKPTPAQKDSTEYAEIIHVQKPEATSDHPPNTTGK